MIRRRIGILIGITAFLVSMSTQAGDIDASSTGIVLSPLMLVSGTSVAIAVKLCGGTDEDIQMAFVFPPAGFMWLKDRDCKTQREKQEQLTANEQSVLQQGHIDTVAYFQSNDGEVTPAMQASHKIISKMEGRELTEAEALEILAL